MLAVVLPVILTLVAKPFVYLIRFTIKIILILEDNFAKESF